MFPFPMNLGVNICPTGGQAILPLPRATDTFEPYGATRPFPVLVATDQFGYPVRKFPLAEFHSPIQSQPGPAPSRFLAIPDMAAAAPDLVQSHPRSWPCPIGTRAAGKYHPKWATSSNFPSSPKGSGGPSPSQKHNGSSRRQRRLSLGLSRAAATRYWKLMPAPYQT